MKPNTSMALPVRMAETLGVGESATTNTLTPTTLRHITQIFEADDCLDNIQKFEETGGGFVPPVVTSSGSGHIISSEPKRTKTIVTSAWQGGTTTVVTPTNTIPLHLEAFANMDEDSMTSTDTIPSVASASHGGGNTRRSNRIAKSGRRVTFSDDSGAAEATPKQPKRKRTSGRKPANSQCDEDLSPEEERRLNIRRQRNKEAAARCRKRRVDLTSDLMGQVEDHEAKKRLLEAEIRQLREAKDELEFILQAHQATCQFSGQAQPQQERLVMAVKSEPVVVEAANAPYIVPDVPEEKPTRPKTLSFVMPALAPSLPREVAAGVVIETPTSVIPALAFDTVSTGFTPCAPNIASIVTPMLTTPTLNTPTNCSSQMRSAEGASDISSSPDYVSL